MLPTCNERLTISNQNGEKVSMLEDSKEAGTGSSGEHLTPYDFTILVISSSVAGSNSVNLTIFGSTSFFKYCY